MMQSIAQALGSRRESSSTVAGDRPRSPAPYVPRGAAQQLPFWPETVRGGPNAILRSALFAGIQSKKRQTLGTQTRPDKKPEGVAIASQDGIEITFAGTQFNQYDADVFFETLHRARHPQKLQPEEALSERSFQPPDPSCQFQGAELLKAIGRSCNNLSYEDLEQSLDRLRRGSVDLKWTANGRQYIFSGSLIAYYVRETTTKTYKVTFAKQILTLFAPASWTQLEWDERQALKGKPLSQWLHSYFSTHAAPFPVTVAFLHEKSGSPTKLQKHFKVELRNALNALETSLGWTITWNRNLVSVARTPSACQTRHLSRRMAKAKREKSMREAQQKQLTLGRPSSNATHQTENEMYSARQVLARLMKAP